MRALCGTVSNANVITFNTEPNIYVARDQTAVMAVVP